MAKNTSKGKEKSLQEKVKQFFGINKETCTFNFDHLKTEPYVISQEILTSLGRENPLNQRLKAINELDETVCWKPLHENSLEFLISKTEDMLLPHFNSEVRHTVLQFYCRLVRGQFEKIDIMRNYIFKLIKNYTISEDARLRFELLKALSDNGKNITYFEEDIGPFLLSWFREIVHSVRPRDFLSVLINVVKFHAAYLDEDIVAGFIEHTSSVCLRTITEEDIQACLDLMDAVLCYSHLPFNVLQPFIYTLCKTVNIEKFAEKSWKVIKDLLGTSLGHASIFTMCKFLQDKSNYDKRPILKGNVFFIGMALWGMDSVPSLRHPPSTVLPFFLKALDCNDGSVAHEMTLSVINLIKRNQNLQIYTWEIVLDIIERLLQYQELQESSPPLPLLANSVHDLLSVTEENIVPACSNRLYALIEFCSRSRNEESVIRLIRHKMNFIVPTKNDFVANLKHLLDVFFKSETRQAIQLEILCVVRELRSSSGYLIEDDLIEQILLPYLLHLDNHPDFAVRKAAVDLLVEFAETCITKGFFDILDILEKVLKRPFDIITNNAFKETSLCGKEIFCDVEAAVLGLINIFKKKLYVLPSSHCVQIFKMLVSHAESHYQKLVYFEESIHIRKMVIEFILKLRCNSQKQMGICGEMETEFSVYILCGSRDVENNPSSPPASPSVYSCLSVYFLYYKDAFQVLIMCLKQEKDWTILELMFKELLNLLQNKALIINAHCSINTLCSSLCALVKPMNDRNISFFEVLKNTPTRFTRTDFQAHVYPVIAALPAYHSELETYMQGLIIKSLQSGLNSKSAKQCIEGLTLCCLEMRNMMIKLLPSVLLKLSKISATVSISGAVLEFLSNLIRLPELYISFVEDQYMSIFAIALPYTNPFKFKQFTVALAHHVIAMWFLKCRIPFRKEFAKFITKSLRNNLSIPQENQNRNSQPSNTDDVKSRNVSGDSSHSNSNQNIDESTLTLHTELMETGSDLMARFTFGMSSNVPQRSAIANFLLEKGQKCSWVVGNKIVTVTTSGCGTKAFKFGLCEKCYASCRDLCDSTESDENESVFETAPAPISDLPRSARRRHQSAFLRRNTVLPNEFSDSQLTKDDILLHRQNTEPSSQYNRRNTSYVPKESSRPILPDESNLDDNGNEKDKGRNLCSCWCSGWAEIHIRRPTGNTSWMMKIQNHLFLPTSPPDIPLPAIASLVLPCQLESKQPSEYSENEAENLSTLNSTEEDDDEQPSSHHTSEAIMCPKPNVSLRRTNSSPDMNSEWAKIDISDEHPHLISESKLEGSSEIEDSSAKDNFEFCATESDLQLKSKPTSKSSHSKSSHVHKNLKLNIGASNPTHTDSDFSANPQSKSANTNTSLAGAFRDRGHTISVMSPAHREPSDISAKPVNREIHRSGMSPSFVFLQLYHNSYFGPSAEKPLLLHQTEANNRALKVLDHIQPYDTHKIGIIYIGPGQVNDECAILSNVYGSVRYMDFIRGLGNLIRLSDVDLESTYVGGLDIHGEDGKFALVWHDDVMQVIFHVATLMPNKKSDTMKTEKKKHIANDFVTIVYNESGEDYSLSTIKGQVTSACVVIHPDDFNSNVITIKVKTNELMETFGHKESYIVSDKNLPIFVRQMALHANLASLILSPRQQSAQYLHVSNWLERLRTIKRLRKKVLDELKLKKDSQDIDSKLSAIVYPDDFTDYV